MALANTCSDLQDLHSDISWWKTVYGGGWGEYCWLFEQMVDNKDDNYNNDHDDDIKSDQ